MAYIGKTNWQNNEIVEASDMNRIEQGILDTDIGLGNVQAEVTAHKSDNTAHGVDTKIPKTLATAANQFLVSSGAGSWVIKTVAQIKTLLGLKSAAYTESSAYAPSSHISVSASTSAKGHVQLTDSVLSTSTTTAATPNSVKQAYDKANVALAEANTYTDQEVGEVAQELAAHQAESASINATGHVYAAELTATLSTSWSGSAAPYTQTVTINGITSAHNPIIDVVMSGTYSTDQQRIEQWGYIYRAVTGTNQITFYASEKPTVSLPIRVKVVM
jgi:hypothetical protein